MRLPFTHVVTPSTDTGLGAAFLVGAFFADAPELMGVMELVGDDIRHLADNAASERFLGVPPAGTANRLASEMGVPADVLTTRVNRYRESRRTGRTVQFEYAHPTPKTPATSS